MAESAKKGGRKRRDDPSIKRRSTRACDQCRKTKSKCELPTIPGNPCKSCEQLEVECTLSGPILRRGPPKGYLHAVEKRLHEVEALLGILISIPDSRATSLLSDLAQDSFSRDILARVSASPFGPAGRNQEQPSELLSASTSQAQKADADPYANGPTNAWQDQVISRFMKSGAEGAAFQAFGSSELLAGAPPQEGPMYPNRNHYLASIPKNPIDDPDSSSYDPYSDSDDAATAIGQLSLDNHDQVRYHGKSSGLHLLSQSGRVDSKHDGGLWRLKDNHAESSTHLEDSDIEMPPLNVQQYLLELFFVYTYASFPVIDREQLWIDFRTIYDRKHNTTAYPAGSISKLLLLAMYSIAARHTPQPPVDPAVKEQETWTAGYMYFDRAKVLLNRTYHISHPVTCQSLLFLGIREFGMGAVAQAWLYVGMAIRMAQDLGMHRSSENWQRDGKSLFTPHEQLTRKRIWYGCVKMDKYISMYMGRPVTIHEKDFDTLIPDDMNEQEFDLWQPHASHPQQGHYVAVPGRFISCCNANSALSLIVCRIIERIYSVRNDNSITAHWTEAMALKQQLDMWMQDLPDHLQIRSAREMLKVPPHVLTLHMQWECAVILVYRRFIRISKRNHTVDGPSLSTRALDSSLPCAVRIRELANAYHTNFTLKHATPFDAFDIFYAGTVWVAALTVHPFDESNRQPLEDCIHWLKEMAVVWPCAARCHHLLNGANVAHSPSDHNQQQQNSYNQNHAVTLGGDDLHLDPTSYASQTLFSDVVGGTIDSAMFNGYMWNSTPYSTYGSGQQNHTYTNGLFDIAPSDPFHNMEFNQAGSVDALSFNVDELFEPGGFFNMDTKSPSDPPLFDHAVTPFGDRTDRSTSDEPSNPQTPAFNNTI